MMEIAKRLHQLDDSHFARIKFRRAYRIVRKYQTHHLAAHDFQHTCALATAICIAHTSVVAGLLLGSCTKELDGSLPTRYDKVMTW